MQCLMLEFMFLLTVHCSHVIRVVYGLSYETIEVTGPQMVLTMKLTTFAWNVYDGRRPQEVCCFYACISLSWLLVKPL